MGKDRIGRAAAWLGLDEATAAGLPTAVIDVAAGDRSGMAPRWLREAISPVGDGGREAIRLWRLLAAVGEAGLLPDRGAGDGDA